MQISLKDSLGPLITRMVLHLLHCTWSINIWNTVLKDMVNVIIEGNMTVHSYSCASPAYFKLSWPKKSPKLTTVNSYMEVSGEDNIWWVTFFLLRIHQAEHHSSHTTFIARAQHIHKAAPGWDRSLTGQPRAVSWLLELSRSQPRLCQTKALILQRNLVFLTTGCLLILEDSWYWFILLLAQHPASPD